MREELEKKLLAKLEWGEMDGMVGSSWNPVPGVSCRQAIVSGIPTYLDILEEEPGMGYRSAIARELKTDEGKLWYLRNAGWKLEDKDARLYSRLHRLPHNA